jgi:hypothetical protein
MGLGPRLICGLLMRLRKLRDVGLGRSISPDSNGVFRYVGQYWRRGQL